MLITKRDEEIKDFLKEVDVADTKTISILFFNNSVRRCQQRLKILVDNNYIKCFRDNVKNSKIFYIRRKPKSWMHKIVFSKLLGELSLQGIEILKYRTPLKVGKIIADGFIAINMKGVNKIYLVEVERTKSFDLEKYIELYYCREYKDLFPVMPSILCITDKKIKYHEKLDIKKCNLDLRNLKL